MDSFSLKSIEVTSNTKNQVVKAVIDSYPGGKRGGQCVRGEGFTGDREKERERK